MASTSDNVATLIPAGLTQCEDFIQFEVPPGRLFSNFVFMPMID